jgi:hypothetical protein
VPHSFAPALAPRIPDDAPLPPPISAPYLPATALTQEQVEEVRRLRREQPFKWSLRKLAKKFQCSYRLIAAIQISKEANEKEIEDMEKIKDRWSERRSKARVDRARRRELWIRDA